VEKGERVVVAVFPVLGEMSRFKRSARPPVTDSNDSESPRTDT